MGLVGKLARRIIERRGYELVPRRLVGPPLGRPHGGGAGDLGGRPAPHHDDARAVLGLIRAVEHLVRWGIPGDVVECGVWRGGSMMAVARTLLGAGVRDRTLWLYDTFAGLPPPGGGGPDLPGPARRRGAGRDGPPRGRRPRLQPRPAGGRPRQRGVDRLSRRRGSATWPARSRRRSPARSRSGSPSCGSTPTGTSRPGTSWSTSIPGSSPAGSLIVDDYGHWQGARRAVDEYLERHRIPLLLCRLDYTGRIAVKPDRESEVGSRE